MLPYKLNINQSNQGDNRLEHGEATVEDTFTVVSGQVTPPAQHMTIWND